LNKLQEAAQIFSIPSFFPDVPGTNVHAETSYPNWRISVNFLSPCGHIPGIVSYNRPRPLHFTPFHISILFFFRSHITSAADSPLNT